VSITRGPDGRLIISSRDTKALDLMEQLAAQLSPPRTDYKIFRLKYAWAYGVALTLEDIFAEEDKKDSRRMPPWYYWDYGTDQSNQDKDRTRLSRRRPVKFISDSDTNSVLVQNADPQQLKKIDELVKFYDQPPPADAQSLRQTELFAIRWAKAAVIADAVKDVYRDLLSSNDKALVNLQQQQRERPRDSYLFLSDGSSEDKEQRVPKFKGLLSVGVDEGSNTLVVSAPAYLMVDIRKLITDLDKAAEPAHTTVEVLKLGRGVPSSVVRQALANAFGETGGAQATPGATPPAGQTKPKAPGQPERHGQQDANQQNR